MDSLVSYYNEISNMMFGFGDSHIPNPDTVLLVERITLNQMRLIVEEATKIQQFADDSEVPESKKTITGEDLVFLLRKNKHKMHRFINYLRNQRSKVNSMDMMPNTTKEKHKLIDFIEYIDETGELTDLSEYDEVKYLRMVRADRISQALNEEVYLKYFQARCTSFMNKRLSQIRNREHLKLWIDPQDVFIFTKDAFEVLSYYAYETVATLVDLALLVRFDRDRKPDPLESLQGNYFSSNMFKSEQFNGPNPDYSNVFSAQPAISVNEINEVMRRIYMPQAGQLNLGNRMISSHNIIVL